MCVATLGADGEELAIYIAPTESNPPHESI